MTRLLDVGCHDGFVGRYLADQIPDLEIHGLELNSQACERARDRGYASVIQGAAEQAPELFEPGTFDVVAAFEVYEHVPDLDTFLDALEAMLKPGGRVFLSTPEGCFGTGSNPHHLRALRAVDFADHLRRRGKILDFEVGCDGVNVAAYTPCERREDVGIYLGACWAPWHPTDIATKGLGGSETAAVRLAEALSEQGFVVTVYGHTEHVAFRQTIYRPHEAFDPCEPRGALICSRIPEVGDRVIKARTKLLWLHDLDLGDRLTPARAAAFDGILVLSEFHRAHVAGRYPFAKHKLVVTRNGLHLPYFGGGTGA